MASELVSTIKSTAIGLVDPENQPHQWGDHDIAALLNEAADRIEALEKAIRLQANAVRTLQMSEETEINRLRKTHHQAFLAARTLDSEKKANAILTDRIEALERVFEAAENVCIAHGMGWDLDGVLGVLNDNVRRARATLGDAKEVRDGE